MFKGVLFIEAGEPVYPGMVIGQNAKTGDMEVNAVKEKEKSNMRYVHLAKHHCSWFMN